MYLRLVSLVEEEKNGNTYTPANEAPMEVADVPSIIENNGVGEVVIDVDLTKANNSSEEDTPVKSIENIDIPTSDVKADGSDRYL